MEYAFFAVFSIVAAMIFNFIQPKIAAMSWAQTTSAKGYVGMTLVTAAGFFVVLAAAGFLMSMVLGAKGAEIPTA